MEIKEQRNETYVTLIPVGDLDANSSVEFDERIHAILESGCPNIHVDGRGIRYISSAGLGVFISYLEELAQQGGRFVISGLADNVRDVFQILGLDKLDHLVLTEAAPQDDQLFAAKP